MELPKNRTSRKIQGLTIVELLIASAIALIVLALVGLIYVASDKSFRFGEDVLDSEANLRLAMDWMTKDIRGASDLSISGDTVFLTIPSASGQTTIAYQCENNKLKRTVGDTGDTRTIARVSMDPSSDIARSDSTVTIVLHATAGNTIRSLTSQVTMRNNKD